MSRQRWLVGAAVLLTASVVALFRPVEPVSAAPPEEYRFAVGNAVRVTRKQGDAFFLSSPKVVQLGDRLCLFGSRVGEDMNVLIPLSDIDLVEQFNAVEDMKKRYRIEAPNPKPAEKK